MKKVRIPKGVLQLPDHSYQDIPIANILGAEDANTEWRNPIKSSLIFFHSDSYDYFKEIDCLYLFGRRGTGKTAIIRMLDYEISNNKIRPYSCSFVVNEEEAYTNLSNTFRHSIIGSMLQRDLINYFVKKWHWIINTSAMLATYNMYSKILGNDNDDIQRIKDFLHKEGLLKSQKPIERFLNIFTEIYSSYTNKTPDLIKVLGEIKNYFFSQLYYDALQSLKNILLLKRVYCLVMIDSVEKYEMEDTIFDGLITSLIEAVRQAHESSEQNRILAKAAFASEFSNRIKSLNPGKIGGKRLFIRWAYRDLVLMLAKRFHNAIGKNQVPVHKDIFSNHYEARNYLYKYFLPKEVISDQGICIDTLAYIIRHTQKTVRQVIKLMNIILAIAKKDGIKLGKYDSEFIKKAVHARLDMLFDEAISIYDTQSVIGKKLSAEELIKTILTGSKSKIYGSDLKYLIDNSKTFWIKYGLEPYDIYRILFESGCIGKVMKTFRKNNIKRVEALFEYQIKRVLTIAPEDECVIHPMMYQVLHNYTDSKVFVYPMPTEKEEEEIIKNIV